MRLLIYKVDSRKKARKKMKSGKKFGLFSSLGISSSHGSNRKNVNRDSTRVDDRFTVKNNAYSRRGFSLPKQKLSFERFMFFTFIIAFSLLIVVQAALMSPTARTFMNGNDEFEGTPLGVEEYLYEEGEIGLKLLQGNPDGQLKVLVNGDEVAAFTGNILNLKVKDGDVVEIDGSDAKEESEVVIVSKSDNINPDSANKRVKVKAGVKKLTQVRID